jgi:hypothetical protein
MKQTRARLFRGNTRSEGKLLFVMMGSQVRFLLVAPNTWRKSERCQGTSGGPQWLSRAQPLHQAFGRSLKSRARDAGASNKGSSTCPECSPSGSLVSILFKVRDSQGRKSVAIDCILPREILLRAERVAAAGQFKRQQAAAHSSNNFRLAPNYPAPGPRRREVGDSQHLTIRPMHAPVRSSD